MRKIGGTFRRPLFPSQFPSLLRYSCRSIPHHTEGPAAGVPRRRKSADPVETGSKCAKSVQPSSGRCAAPITPGDASVPRCGKSAEPVKAGSKCAKSAEGCAGRCWHNLAAYSRRGTLTGGPSAWKSAEWVHSTRKCARMVGSRTGVRQTGGWFCRLPPPFMPAPDHTERQAVSVPRREKAQKWETGAGNAQNRRNVAPTAAFLPILPPEAHRATS
ncbi:hypothetical protein V490_06951 [Pseudogymnoascus sp. VKM F-3557]|nr:hypothetical protein V490_06951 [Pseudogymnoascus sp. VKM F-3557]